MKNLVNKEDRSELLGQMIDVFEKSSRAFS